MQASPVLAGCLADVNALRALQGRRPLAHPWRALRRHVPRATGWRGRRRLLGWLGLPPERAFLRTLRRVERLSHVFEVAELARAWAHPRVRKRLLHLPRLCIRRTSLLTRLLPDPALLARLDFRLLASLGEGRDGARTLRAVAQLVELRQSGGIPLRVPPLRTLDDVERFHRTTFLLSHWALHRNRDAFPPPPLEGDARVQPLPSWDAIIDEGTLQENCLKHARWAMMAAARLGYGLTLPPNDGPPGR